MTTESGTTRRCQSRYDDETDRFYPRPWAGLAPIDQEAVIETIEDLAVAIDRGAMSWSRISRLIQAKERLRATVLGRPLGEAQFWCARSDEADPLCQAGDPNEGMRRR